MSEWVIVITREDINNKDEVNAHYGDQARLPSHDLSAARYQERSLCQVN